jgi:hypothetical protein
MSTVRYRGFDIVSRPYELAETGEWTVDLTIRRNERFRTFSVNERYATVEEADAQCVGLGRRIIDNRVKGWSVDALREGNSLWSTLTRLVVHDSLGPLIVALAAILGIGRAILRLS